MNLFARYIVLLIVTVCLSLSFSTASNADIPLDSSTSHELPADNNDGDDNELEVEIYETISMIEASYFHTPFLCPHVIGDHSPVLFDNFINKIDIPPSPHSVRS